METRLSALGAALLGLALSGCLAIPADRGVADARRLAGERSNIPDDILLTAADPAAAGLAERLLATPIGVNEAVQLALLRNPRAQALYAELGFSAAEIYDATRLANPSLSYLRLSTDAVTGGAQTTWSIAQNFTTLLFMSYHMDVGRAAQLRAQQRTAQAVLALEAEVREAFYEYAGAQLAFRMRSVAARSARLSADLAVRFHEAGNISVLQLSREQAAASEAAIGERRLQVQAGIARSRLLTLLGLRTDDSQPQFATELGLPMVLPANANALAQLADRQRLDLAALRTEVGMRQMQLTHVRRWRWLGGLALGAEYEREPDGEVRKGPGASLELPVFNSGRGALLRATASSENAAAQLAGLELAMVNEIATQYEALEASRLIVDEYRTQLMPLKERIVDTSQREQNFMIIGAFELLAAQRDEIDTYERYIDAVRDYWIERTRLARTVGGTLPGDETPAEPLTLPAFPDAGGGQ